MTYKSEKEINLENEIKNDSFFTKERMPLLYNKLHPYDIVKSLEERIAEYAGAPYAVAVDSCTNALLLCFSYWKHKYGCKEIILPCRTYVGVAFAAKNAGLKIKFIDYVWEGCYLIGNTNIVDSARRFRKGMYPKNTLYCLSAHWSKHLKIGRGGFILTDNIDAVNYFKKARFDGRAEKVIPTEDTFDVQGFHCYQLPEEAARGLMLMASMPDYNKDLPWDGYADLSKLEIFK
jgi:dTDP-4-amino-4,6-dideoxygalactose transaminase